MLRNKELRHFAICFLLPAAVSVTAGVLINERAGVLAAVSAAVYGAAFLAFTKKRYDRLAQIADQIDLALHDENYLCISESEEGELSILQDEITKMTLRIREQNAILKKEKENLADSLADIAHQLRTPLTSVNLILSLAANTADERERRGLLREAEELLVQTDHLITSLLKLSRLDAGVVDFKRQQIETRRLIDTALHPLRISMELHNITVQTELPENVYIQGDFDWLTEAVRNILRNCMDSAGDNGRIGIVCRDTLLYTEIEIRDSGPGFEKEDLHSLFDRFYRGKNSNTAGYGIGLALCKKIIRGQEGTVTAGNHPQGGAVFSIQFQK